MEWWNTGKRQKPKKSEQWNDGIWELEEWNNGMVEYWETTKVKEMGWWNGGIQNWKNGMIEYWNIAEQKEF